ncbi:UDP-2,4-diacetamido-2,4,6-trideoxy-beta-L-altropyranose hydrolase [Salisaeta longa]|uniref:UDP-2,4-diacetamido-2,4, 6-trideoxy-beta-L-altropyranose hydrolase n=1 Tax=Salisaeta longa TaxID=503170 RepID=UPI000427383C|nr:UDP-2,4-diacetamido-2,4,6-trideoxy-beta-L-altropyranose hydrolase [Salisaeta longa]
MLDPLLIRADASPEMGTGHVMRCLALAQEWMAQGGQVAFCGNVTPALQKRLQAEGIQGTSCAVPPGSLRDAEHTARLAREANASWVVIDGYHFDGDYQAEIRDQGFRVLALDDYGHASHYAADLVLNQNIDADASLYADRADHTTLLLGPQFALLRKEFWPWRGTHREPTLPPRRILVTLGGGDPDNVTTDVIRALDAIEHSVPLEVTVVVGGSNPHRDAIARAIAHADQPMTLREDVSNMAALMAQHDMAVSAGGSTCWELAFMGLPSVIVILAENQRGIAEGLDEAGASVNLGWHAEVTPHDLEAAFHALLLNDNKRLQMAQSAQYLVDGKGVQRVIDTIRAAHHTDHGNAPSGIETSMRRPDDQEADGFAQGESAALTLRPVEDSDCRRLWEWANDPEVRRQSYNTGEIPWEDHKEWFRRKRASDDCTIYIAEFGGDPVGQIRFDVEDERSVVDVHVDPDQHGKGFGTKIIKEGTGKFLDLSDLNQVHAYIKIDNIASCRAFEKAGYAYHGKSSMKGQESYCYIASSSD